MARTIFNDFKNPEYLKRLGASQYKQCHRAKEWLDKAQHYTMFRHCSLLLWDLGFAWDASTETYINKK